MPGGGPPALVTRMSSDPNASVAAVTNPVAPAGVPTSATSAGPGSAASRGRGRVDAAPVAAADRDPRPLRDERGGRRVAEPGRAAATAAVRPVQSELHGAYRTPGVELAGVSMSARIALDEVAALGEHDYLADEGLATAIFLALRLHRPLLLEGEAGVGKTEVAKVLARWTGGELVRLQCYEGIDVAQAVYEWDYSRQLLHLRAAEAAGERWRRRLVSAGGRAVLRAVPRPPAAAPGHRARATGRRRCC